MKTHSDMSEYFRVPKLGQHYTMRWAAEDMEYERTKSNANIDCENTDRNNTSGQPEGTLITSKSFYHYESYIWTV